MNRWMGAALLAGGVAVLLADARADEQPARPGRRPFVGIAVDPAADGGKGVLVRDVAPDSPADKAGIKAGDRVLRVGGKEVRDLESLTDVLAAHKPGDKVDFQVVRDGKEQKLTLTLAGPPGRRGPGGEGREREGAYLGVRATELTSEWKEKLEVTVEKGAVLTAVAPGTPAARAGLRAGDVIVSVGGKAVDGPGALRDAVQAAGAGKEVAVAYVRGKDKKEAKVRLEEGPADGPAPFPAPGFRPPPFREGAGRLGELERRVQELEKRVRELEKQRPQPK